MADPIDPTSRAEDGLITILPASVTGPTPQNPAPFDQVGQVDESRVRAVADQIVTVFINSLPSNYVAETKGPYYTEQFQAVAEELARIQVTLEDAYEDVDFRFTRPEVLFQFLATLVFPTSAQTGLPQLDGDLTYREFLRKMVVLLLAGSKTTTLLQGVEALTDAEVTVLDEAAFIGLPGVGWTIANRFTFEINVTKTRRTSKGSTVDPHYHTVKINALGSGTTTGIVWDDGSGPDHVHTIENFLVNESSAVGLPLHTHDLLSDFADLPLVLAKNVQIVMRALRPGHTLYEYRNLFRETFRHVFTDVLQEIDLDEFFYEDFRKYCTGIRELTSTTGVVLADRYTVNDIISFRSVRVGAPFVVTSGPNAGRYQVRETASFPFGDDPIARPYSTSPTGLTGTATVVNGAIVDPSQDWALAEAGEILFFNAGPNTGEYLLETVLGLNGGPVGSAVGPATEVRPAVCFLRVGPRFAIAGGPLSYTVEVDRLGVRGPIAVVNEDIASQFFSPPIAAIDTIVIANGPLVRPWGDATPAIPEDITVLYDGAPVTVTSVNPYLGTVTIAPAIATFAPGAHTVTVSYSWFPGPLMGFSGLNNTGLTLNRWSLGGGRHVSTPGVGVGVGGYFTSRFPLSLGLGLNPRRKPPIRIAHRYIAFERAYTAALNSPTTLLLNQAPGRVSVPYADADVSATSVQYEGTAAPTSPWGSHGAVTGVSDGDRYDLSDASATEVGYWSRDFELPVSSQVGTAARFQVEDYTLDGVFTGIGFGFHNDRRLFLAGALVVNGLKHIGLLARPGEMRALGSWIVGPKAAGTILSATVVTCPLDQAPRLLAGGQKFQILSGNQTGVYTVEQVFLDPSRNLATIVVQSPGFPANPALFGNKFADLIFETEWDAGQCTWRLYASTSNNVVQLYFGGATGGSLVTVSGGPVLASPAYLGPDVLPEGSGRYLWGSFSRKATNRVSWDFVRYLSTPDGGTKFSRGTIIDTTMTGEPEDAEWFRTTPYGDTANVGGLLRLTGTPADPSLDTQFGYGYIDPFLNGRRVVAFDAHLFATRDTSGAGGMALTLKDTHREARLGNLLFQDNGPAGKVVFPQDTISLVGATDYTSQGWFANTTPGFETPRTFANGPETLISGAFDGTSNGWLIGHALPPTTISVDRTLEFRASIDSFTLSSGGANSIGFIFFVSVSNRLIALTFTGPDVVNLVDVTFGPLASAPVAWSDGEPRTYRIEVNPSTNIVELYVDDVLVASTAYLGFPIFPGPSDGMSFGFLAESGNAVEASVFSLALMKKLDGVPNLHRTFGLWKGGDFGDLDNWEIPRTDGLSVPNSDPASVIVDMDWTIECWVRLFVDPTFGAVFIRPDLPAPPGYTGNFATQSLDPTAAWAKIEYARLPRAVSDSRFGSVFFGKLNPAASSLQFWDEVRYRVFTHINLDYRAPQRMALNQWNVVTSGDYLKDLTPEQVIVASLTTTRVSLRPAHIFANRVFQVIVEGVPLSPTTYRFNVDSQEIFLTNPLPSVGFPVTVVFAVGKPVTTTYLQTQPLPESQTILNEGTPPVPMSQVGTFTVSTLSGDGGPTPAFPPALPSNPNWFLRDQYLTRQFAVDPDDLYEQMDFFQIDDGGATGKISTFCDGVGTGPLVGPGAIGLDGATFSENFSPVASPFVSNFRRAAGSFAPILYASGGSTTAMGLLGPAIYVTPYNGPNPAPTGLRPAMLYPTGPDAGVVPGSRGPDAEVVMVLQIGAGPPTIIWP